MLPHRRVGLVLGCSRRLGDGTPNPFFENRVRAAIELFRAEKVDFLLVSGDNRTLSYNEATYMQQGFPHVSGFVRSVSWFAPAWSARFHRSPSPPMQSAASAPSPS